MNVFSFNADQAVMLFAIALALYGAYEALRAIRARAILRAVFWCAGTVLSALVALFLATFHIRLM